MKPLSRGIAVGVLQCLIALSVFGKYAMDRERLPRAWAPTVLYDPDLPLRGRYLSLRVAVETPPDTRQNFASGRLTIRNGHLFVQPDRTPSGASDRVRILRLAQQWVLAEPLAFFLPEHGTDPLRPPAGKQRWVEVSVPRKGPPRPIRLEIR